MTKILVCGADGQMGQSFRAVSGNFPALSFRFASRSELDIADSLSVDEFFRRHAFDFCINCAAYTAVDRAEQETAAAFAINADGAAYLAEKTFENGCALIHFSTDYVFHGGNGVPFREDDPTGPKGVYARSKLAGEKGVLAANPRTVLIRASWIYSEFGHNFVRTMLRLGAEKDRLSVVCDQVGTPTYGPDLAAAVLTIISVLVSGAAEELLPFGIYHYSNEGVASWYDFAKAVFDLSGLPCEVIPIATRDYPTPAERPPYSLLDKSKIKTTFNLEIPYWRDSLKVCLTNI
ncbi:MAG TPA: dTDP-4-dehydrorhamnose reductase [Flavilitoribacter sp.]|nr:dTDP-4-dehydrorhamnose reductase [Flavilitoribacter sp.]HMQ87471.1 dTDP-4-dehydrorhamnose reductase [Flavilitoribacter sp.]